MPAQYSGYALTKRSIALRYEVSNDDSTILQRLDTSTLLNVYGQVYDEAGTAWSRVSTLDRTEGYVVDSSLRYINAQEAEYYLNQWKAANSTPTPRPTSTMAPVQVTGYAYTIGDNYFIFRDEKHLNYIKIYVKNELYIPKDEEGSDETDNA